MLRHDLRNALQASHTVYHGLDVNRVYYRVLLFRCFSNQIPSSMEQLLERHWEQGSQFLVEQGQHFDCEFTRYDAPRW